MNDPFPIPYCAPVRIDGNQNAVGVHPCDPKSGLSIGRRGANFPTGIGPKISVEGRPFLPGEPLLDFSKEFTTPELIGPFIDSGNPEFGGGGSLPIGTAMTGDGGGREKQPGVVPNNGFF